MILVIPVGKNRPPGSLRHAVRAFTAHTPATQLVTIGEPPEVTPDEHWPSPNTDIPGVNTGRHFRLAAERLTEPFIWAADDIFLLADWTPCVHARAYSIQQHFNDFPRVPVYSVGTRKVMNLMRAEGHDPRQVPCGAIHRPTLMDPVRLMSVLDRLEAAGIPGGFAKTLYVAGLDGVVVAGDPKVRGREQPKPGMDCVSTEPGSWKGPAGEFVRATFMTPSRYEPQAAASSRGSHI